MKLKLTGIVILLTLFSCKTYTITPESFKSQFANSSPKKTKEVEINNPVILPYSTTKYLSNDIKYLNVKDKNGNLFFMPNSPSLEMRVTDKKGKKFHFYFDTVTLENDTLKGGRSRIMPSITRGIPFSDIVKIEVQEGGKNYQYQNQ